MAAIFREIILDMLLLLLKELKVSNHGLSLDSDITHSTKVLRSLYLSYCFMDSVISVVLRGIFHKEKSLMYSSVNCS